MTREIGVGIIGTGFMGACHALAFRAAPAVFESRLGARLEMVADIDAGAAEAAARRFGFARWTDDWRRLVEDPKVDLVAITTPNHLHPEMAIAAAGACKAIYCEKPLAPTLDAARKMVEAAERAGVVTLAGYNYLRSPVIEHAAQLIAEGAIGRPIHFRGQFDEDYMADPATPFSWRCRRDAAGTGVLGDMASHLVAVARRLMGPVERVVADTVTVIPDRPLPAAGDGTEKRGGAVALDPTGATRRVENEDTAQALVRFEGGVLGSLMASRVHWGRKNHLSFEVFGTEGALSVDHERMNEMQLFRRGEAADRSGFRTLLVGPAHPHYARFSPAPGHGLGFNDLKVIEVAQLLDSLAGGPAAWPDFRGSLEIEGILAAIERSAESGAWVTPDPVPGP